jgi:pyruvate-formate lyase-activating enzyme
MANIGYIQVVRHCNHFCGFCSNPTTPYVHTFETMKVLVDDFVDRGYFGVILTGASRRCTRSSRGWRATRRSAGCTCG